MNGSVSSLALTMLSALTAFNAGMAKSEITMCHDRFSSSSTKRRSLSTTA
jgi:hypothetical protein